MAEQPSENDRPVCAAGTTRTCFMQGVLRTGTGCVGACELEVDDGPDAFGGGNLAPTDPDDPAEVTR